MTSTTPAASFAASTIAPRRAARMTEREKLQGRLEAAAGMVPVPEAMRLLGVARSTRYVMLAVGDVIGGLNRGKRVVSRVSIDRYDAARLKFEYEQPWCWSSFNVECALDRIRVPRALGLSYHSDHHLASDVRAVWIELSTAANAQRRADDEAAYPPNAQRRDRGGRRRNELTKTGARTWCNPPKRRENRRR